ncbi:MAG: DUF1549 domain-containing protein [Fuerstiella sp.]
MNFVPKWTQQATIVALLAGLTVAGLRADETGASEPADRAEMSVGEFVDAKIRQGYEDNEIEASPIATDEEWVRRVYLDIVGRIPSLTEVTEFLADESPRKRPVLIDRLLESPDYVRNLTTIWTNNCVGRGEPRGNNRAFSRTGMEKFFREAFARNVPWDEVVIDLVTSEGHWEENGAVNYTLAQMQMPDEAVQLTAKTTKLFLGMQVQCTQCHNHPFNNWQQSQFWEFNSFFRQVRNINHQRTNPDTGRREQTYREVVLQDFSGPVYYEKRSGLMQVAFPEYLGQKIDPNAFDRRKEFSRLLVSADHGETPLIAKAFVNRTWGQFFGYGFTRPVDDMGPHNPASHPEVLERLSAEFVRQDYDVRQLIRWIANSEAYQLTSQFNDKNQIDNPAAGEMPLFSHMYIKSMQAEQLYDSLIVATNAQKTGRGGWDEQEEQRRRWMQQFVVAFDNDENDEATTFNGTIPQALMMMNSEMIEKAVSAERGSFLYETFSGPGKEMDKLQKLYLAALSRYPTRREATQAMSLVRQYGQHKAAAYQDLFWALLNSNEFIFVH